MYSTSLAEANLPNGRDGCKLGPLCGQKEAGGSTVCLTMAARREVFLTSVKLVATQLQRLVTTCR
jgi:hypothetical protein